LKPISLIFSKQSNISNMLSIVKQYNTYWVFFDVILEYRNHGDKIQNLKNCRICVKVWNTKLSGVSSHQNWQVKKWHLFKNETKNTWTYHDHLLSLNPDIDVEEMKESDSKAKYVHGRCQRWTMPLTLATEKTDDSDADDSSNGTDDSSSELSWSDSN